MSEEGERMTNTLEVIRIVEPWVVSSRTQVSWVEAGKTARPRVE